MSSLDMTQSNVELLAQLFPNVVTEIIDEEGKKKRVIDFDLLKQELSEYVTSEKQERYQMTWPDKKQSILLANKGISSTLRPIFEKSLDFNTTRNIYIEGDNLDVLKLLRETYLGKIKLIYIDPPYNTGNDFIYNDDYSSSQEEYIKNSGQIDSEKNRLFVNTDSNGRFHTDWLNLMYPRLKVARDFLMEEGTIFISIDVNEQHNLRKICDEVFGEKNFVTDIIWNSRKSVSNDAVVSLNHNYTLVYTKNMDEFYKNKSKFKLPDLGEGFDNPDNDPRGKWKADPFDSPGFRPNLTYKIVNPNTNVEYWPPEGRCWRTGEKEFLELLQDKRIVFGKNGKSGPQLKRFYSDAKDKGLTPKSLWDDCGTATDGTKEILDLFGKRVFDTPKPGAFIKKIIELATDKDDLIMDFFSGSGTLGHAIMELNADEGTRHYICIQLDEDLDENYKSATPDGKKIILNAIELCDSIKAEHNLAVVGEERIRRAGKKIKEKAGILGSDLDIGFRVFKLDSSNMNEVYYNPKALTQNLLEATIDNVKPDRTPLDLLFQVMLECGALLSSKIEEKTINGKKIFVVEDNYIAACFDDELDDKTIEEIAKLHPVYACFKGSSFDSDSANINAEQIFKTYSPNTEKVKVI